MVNVERILCPIELSPVSNEALRYAIALAREYGAKLLICNCAATAPVPFLENRRDLFKQQIGKSIQEALIRHLGLTTLSHLDWESVVIEGDDPGREITREAAARRVDLIVMRSQARTFQSALLGSTAEEICRTAPCSVLVTHPHEREWVGLTTCEVDLRRVLVAHDFSDYSELALQYGCALAKKFQSELHLLHVLPEPEAESPELAWVTRGNSGEPYHVAVRSLQQAIPEALSLARNVKFEVRTGKPFEEIISYAKENEIDLISIGAHGAGFGLYTLFGSNADRVLRQSPCPVLIARPLKPLPVN